jgi:hypothetical protein
MLGSKYSFHIAVEKYQDPSIKAVDFAEADAKELAATLQLHHFESGAQQLLLSAQATKAATESKLSAAIRRLGEDDTFFLSYAGHGFSKMGENFLTCYDTQQNDSMATSLSLQRVYADLRASACKRSVLFLDSCESGILDMPARSIFSQLTPTELENFFSGAEFCVCFASSETFQNSYSAASLKHGIWTYHLIEALKGDVPGILENGRYLTATALQDHLKRSVPETVAKTFSQPLHQTPRFYGTQTNGNFLIADLQEVLDNRAALSIPGYQQVTRLMLTGSTEYQVKKLSGFAKHHKVPDEINEATERFVARIGSNEVEKEVGEVFRLLRTKMGYSRQGLSSNVDSGAGSIITPDFDYYVSMALDASDPGTAILTRELSNIKTPKLIDSASFGDVFAKRFSSLELELKEEIRIDNWIDKIESLKKQGDLKDIQIDYPKDCSYCEIRFKDFGPTITLRKNSCQISQLFVEPPVMLFKKLVQAEERLLAEPELRRLPF